MYCKVTDTKMKEILKSLFLVFVLLMPFGISAQTINKLTVAEAQGSRGETIHIPIILENTDPIVAVEFNLEIGYVENSILDLNWQNVTLGDRAEDHVVEFTGNGHNSGHLLIYSPTNTPFKANAGVIASIECVIPSNATADTTYPLTLSEYGLILADRDANNVLTDHVNGSVTIADGPDFIIKNVRPDRAIFGPGDKVKLTVEIENIGKAANNGPFYLVYSLVGDNNRRVGIYEKYISDIILQAGEKVSDVLEFEVANSLPFEGKAHFEVSLIPDNYFGFGEGLEKQLNNTAQSDDVTVSSGLMFVGDKEVSENAGSYFLHLYRSGNLDAPLEVKLELKGDVDGVSCPEKVTMQPNNYMEWIEIMIEDNSIHNPVKNVTITASADGFSPIEHTFAIIDDERPKLTLQLSHETLTEGQKGILTISTDRFSDTDVNVNISHNHTPLVKIPSNVIIPKGQNSVEVEVEAVEDDEVSGIVEVTIQARADEHPYVETVYLIVEDNDLPQLNMTITPQVAEEDAGLKCFEVVLSRSGATNTIASIRLSDNGNNDIYYPTREIKMAKGVETVRFNLGVNDNGIVEGDRDVTITAAVYLSACNCTAPVESGAAAVATVKILDNDLPLLGATVNNPTVGEGSSFDIIISRNTVSDSPLVVNISTDCEDVEYPSKVIIPAGEMSVTARVSVKKNTVQNDTHMATFIVSAEGFSSVKTIVQITDRTLADAVISDLKVLSTADVLAGDCVDVEAVISNIGLVDLAPGYVTFGRSDENSYQNKIYYHDPIPAGASQRIIGKVTMPDRIGRVYVEVGTNQSREIPELTYSNNTKTIEVDLKPSFVATLASSKTRYDIGEEVTLTGHAEGRNVANAKVEVYAIHKGTRQATLVETDEDGNFTFSFTPDERQCGHFDAGACYPGESSTKVLASFDMTGLMRGSANMMTVQGFIGITDHVKTIIVNPMDIEAKGVKVSIDTPDNYTVSCNQPGDIAANGQVELEFALTAKSPTEGYNWQRIPVTVSMDNGPDLSFVIYSFASTASGKLELSTDLLDLTVVSGSAREIPVTITNVGYGETGPISIALPDVNYLSLLSQAQLPSLASGEKATMILGVKGSVDMPLNIPMTGNLGINCENADGVVLKYRLEAVSERTGKLIVDVRDDYTYNTVEAPHVEGATVSICHPTTGKVIVQGTTDADGLFSVDIPEGNYSLQVSEPRHFGGDARSIIVNAGRDNMQIVNLCYNAVTVKYDVVETTVEDEYSLVTTVEFETNVPAPVVVITGPKGVLGEDMRAGDTKILNFVITNHGLVKAANTCVYLPENTASFTFEPLTDMEIFDLGPHQSRGIPVLMTCISNGSETQSLQPKAAKGPAEVMDNCVSHLFATYETICGESILLNRAAHDMALKFCAAAAIGSAIFDGLDWMSRLPQMPTAPLRNPNVPGHNRPTSPGRGPIEYGRGTGNRGICDPVVAEAGANLIGGLAGMYGGPAGYALGCANSAADYALHPSPGNALGMGRQLASPLIDAAVNNALSQAFGSGMGEALGSLMNTAQNVNNTIPYAYTMAHPHAQALSFGSKAPQISEDDLKGKYLWMVEYGEAATRYIEFLKALNELATIALGDIAWFDRVTGMEKELFMPVITRAFETETNGGEKVTSEMLESVRPAGISPAMVQAYIDHVRNLASGDSALRERVSELSQAIMEMTQEANDKGFMSCTDMFTTAYQAYDLHFQEESKSVCATITLQFKQSMYLTRQAFRGTLTIFNGHETNPITGARLHLTVRDKYGELAESDRFEVHLEELREGFTGASNLEDPNGWSLDAQKTGIATILYIPTKKAAPTESQMYTFAGTVEYVDPFTGTVVTRELSPTSLMVKPCPELDLTYFMQRDVYGDDALTEDKVEPSVPAEFSMILFNKGAGDATDVRFVTEQPQIIDNHKGLLIDFELLSSQLNGSESTIALGGSVPTEFGTIAPNTGAYAQWWFISSLLGHFTNYRIDATHVTSFGNPDLSLLDKVSIHELIRSVDVPWIISNADSSFKTKGFVVNDKSDFDDKPDTIYLTDGSSSGVAVAEDLTSVAIDDDKARISIADASKGWIYGSVPAPFGIDRDIAKVVDNYGKELPVRNVWATTCTMRDGFSPLYENRIHIVDYRENEGPVEYTVTFEDADDMPLEVESFVGVPDADSYVSLPVESLVVNFNKSIQPDTFNEDDITLTREGSRVDKKTITIVPVEGSDNKSFRINFGAATYEAGFYVLTVATHSIVAADGFKGQNGKSASWLQYDMETGLDGTVAGGSGIWPECTRDFLNVRVDADVEFVIYDASGREVSSGELHAGKQTVDVHGLSSGVYIFSMPIGTHRFVKM